MGYSYNSTVSELSISVRLKQSYRDRP